MFCPNCGKELNEGEVCTCTQNCETTVLSNPEPAVEQPAQAPVEAQEQPNYYTPPVQQEYTPEQQGYNPEVNNVGVFPGAYYDPNQAYTNVQPVEEVPARNDYPEGYKIKRKYVAVILAASLGMFGIHNFYLGDNNKAIAQLLVATIGSIFFGLGIIVTTVWATVEAVLLLVDKIDRDANGFKIQTFEEAIAAQMKKD